MRFFQRVYNELFQSRSVYFIHFSVIPGMIQQKHCASLLKHNAQVVLILRPLGCSQSDFMPAMVGSTTLCRRNAPAASPCVLRQIMRPSPLMPAGEIARKCPYKARRASQSARRVWGRYSPGPDASRTPEALSGSLRRTPRGSRPPPKSRARRAPRMPRASPRDREG